MSGRSFGLGEQHVYLIERSETIVVRYRNAGGDMAAKTIARADRRSIALTVEGYADDGSAILAIATDAPALAASPSVSVPSDLASAPPSPTVAGNGIVAAGGALAELAPASLILGDTSVQTLVDGAKWKANGALTLPLGPFSLQLQNAAAAWSGEADVLQVTSAGTFDASGAVTVPGFGSARLKGAGTAAGLSFVDQRARVLLGTSFSLASRGNAVNRQGDVGAYTLAATLTLKLMRYVPGILPPPTLAASAIPGLINTAVPDTDVFRKGGAAQVAQPAATNTIFLGSPLPVITPTPVPDASLPPVPLPASSDAPLASPPAPPPPPTPTFTPH